MILLVIFSVIFLIFGFVVFFGAPYVPSHHTETKRAFEELYPLSDKDTLVDVGSGDGIILRLAAKHGAKAVGYELNPVLVAIARFLSRNQPKVSVTTANFWRKPLPDDVTIVYAFAVTRDGKRLVKRLQEEADRLGGSFHVMTYGSRLPGRKATDKRRAHYLYEFQPLQSAEA